MMKNEKKPLIKKNKMLEKFVFSIHWVWALATFVVLLILLSLPYFYEVIIVFCALLLACLVFWFVCVLVWTSNNDKRWKRVLYHEF